jgi:3-dehydroquinate synthase
VITVSVELGNRSYPILIGAGLLDDAAPLAARIDAKQLLVVTNDVVGPLYLHRLRPALHDRDIVEYVLPDGEAHKSLASFSELVDCMIENRLHRDCCVVALGGGVVGDIAGFVAATYQRGVDFVQIPTTLLAQVDSSVGGKTAVNHPQGKNMIGAFHQPIAVVTDTTTLRTLPRRELSAGLAEVIKYGLIADATLFAWLEEHIEALLALDPTALEFAICRSCEIKAAIVAEDERELGRRAVLNYGHTFGHALESLGHYTRWLHGEAVAIGMLMAADCSARLGWLSDHDVSRLAALLERAGLPIVANQVAIDAMLDRMQLDKKTQRSGMRLVLLRSLGDAVVAPAPARSVVQGAIGGHLGA